MSHIDKILELIDTVLDPVWLMTKKGMSAHADNGYGRPVCSIGHRLYQDTAEAALAAPKCRRCIAHLESLT